MPVGNWLAGLAGGLDAVDKTKHDDEELQLANRKVDVQESIAQLRADVMAQLGQLRADTSKGNNANTNDTKKTIADANREAGTQRAVDKLKQGYDFEAGRNSRFDKGEAGRNTRADDALGYLWDKNRITEDANYMNDDTRQRGQDLGASTAMRGQDLTHGDRQDALGQGARATHARTALGIMGLAARQKPAIFGDNANPTDWAAEFDKLYNEPDYAALTAAQNPAAAPPAAPVTVPGNGLPPAARPAMPAPRAPGGTPSAPRRPMPGPRQPPPASPQAGVTAPTIQVGDVRTVKGQSVRITRIYPDGTFDAEPVK